MRLFWRLALQKAKMISRRAQRNSVTKFIHWLKNTFNTTLLNRSLTGCKARVNPLIFVAGSKTPPHLCIIKQNKTKQKTPDKT